MNAWRVMCAGRRGGASKFQLARCGCMQKTSDWGAPLVRRLSGICGGARQGAPLSASFLLILVAHVRASSFHLNHFVYTFSNILIFSSRYSYIGGKNKRLDVVFFQQWSVSKIIRQTSLFFIITCFDEDVVLVLLQQWRTRLSSSCLPAWPLRLMSTDPSSEWARSTTRMRAPETTASSTRMLALGMTSFGRGCSPSLSGSFASRCNVHSKT